MLIGSAVNKTNAIQPTSRTRTDTRLHITSRCEADSDNKDTVLPMKDRYMYLQFLSPSPSLHSFKIKAHTTLKQKPALELSSKKTLHSLSRSIHIVDSA